MRIVSLMLVTLVLGLQLQLWVGDQGVAAMWRLEEAIEAQASTNRRLAERNQRLEAEVGDLKEGLQAIEARARREFGMVRRGETFYQFVD